MPDPRDEIDVRIVHVALGAGRPHEPRAHRPHRHLHGIPQPGAHGQDDLARSTPISGGRAELGIGAGWKREEWLAFGYPFPPIAERLAILSDHLEVITRMLEPGDTNRAALHPGPHASVAGADQRPKPIQRPRVPIMVGGNGPNVTWRLAAKHADELNLDGMPPADVEEALPVIAARCEEIGRDPASLRVSVHTWPQRPGVSARGAERVDLLGAYRELGIVRLQMYLDGYADDDSTLESLAEDVRGVRRDSRAVTARSMNDRLSRPTRRADANAPRPGRRPPGR